MMGTRPVLKPPVVRRDGTGPRHTINAISHLENGADGLGSRFFSADNAAALGPRLLQLIAAQLRFVLFRQRCALEQIEPTLGDLQYIYSSNMEVEYQLLDMPFALGSIDITAKQNAVRLALYIHTQPIISVAKSSAAFSRRMTLQLKEALEQSELSKLWSPNCDLLLWVLFVCAHICYEQAEWPWLIEYIAKVAIMMGLETLDALQAVLEEFSYCPRTFGETLERIWKELRSFRGCQ